MLALNLLGGRRVVGAGQRGCSVCGLVLPVEQFGARGAGRYRSECRACVNAYNRAYYRRHVARARAQSKANYERQKAARPLEWMLERKRTKARADGVEFSITDADIAIPEFCPVLGIRLAAPGSGDVDASPSLDRIDPARGYVPGNVAVMSWRANRIKNDGSAQEHELVAAWMRTQGRS